MPFVIWRVGWPQDVANMRKKLKSLSFSRVSEVAFGPLFRVPLLRFGHEIRWCFAVAHVLQSHAFCDWRAGWLLCRISYQKILSRFSNIHVGFLKVSFEFHLGFHS